jgi:hypothetical protein
MLIRKKYSVEYPFSAAYFTAWLISNLKDERMSSAESLNTGEDERIAPFGVEGYLVLPLLNKAQEAENALIPAIMIIKLMVFIVTDLT